MVAPIVAAGLAIASKKIAKVAVRKIRKLTKQKKQRLDYAIETSDDKSKEFKSFAKRLISNGYDATNVIRKWKKR